MQKPDGLRRLLLASVPGLRDAADRLQLFVDRGRVAARAGRTLSFEYRYTLTVVVTDYAGAIDAITLPILAWIAEAEPALLTREDQEPFAFEAEILDADTADVQIRIDLTERVRVSERAGGGWDVVHVDEATAAIDAFPGVCGVTLWQLYLRDLLIAQTSDPAFVPPVS